MTKSLEYDNESKQKNVQMGKKETVSPGTREGAVTPSWHVTAETNLNNREKRANILVREITVLQQRGVGVDLAKYFSCLQKTWKYKIKQFYFGFQDMARN